MSGLEPSGISPILPPADERPSTGHDPSRRPVLPPGPLAEVPAGLPRGETPPAPGPAATAAPRPAGGAPTRRRLPPGLGTGALLHLLGMLAALVSGSGLSYFGVTNDKISATIEGDYAGLLFGMLGRMTLVHLLVGAVLGGLVGRMLALAGPRWSGVGPASRVLRIALGVLLLHGLFLCSSMAHYPQLYVEGFYGRGGLLAWFEELVTLQLPAWLWPLLLLGVTLGWAALELRGLLRGRAAGAARAGAAAPRAQAAFGSLLALVVAGLLGTTVVTRLTPPPTPDATGQALARVIAASSRPSNTAGAAGEDGRPPNILLLAADSLRPDRMGDGTQGSRPTTPHIARLAREGVSFERAYTVLPRTFPAWVSLLTGQYPLHSGIRTMFPTAVDRHGLPATVPTLLSRQGYTTAVISDFAGDIFTRVDLGFDRVQAPYFHFPTLIQQRALELDHQLLPYIANRLGRRAFPVLEELAQNADPALLTDRVLEAVTDLPEPWFVVVFYSTAHFPYAAPAPYYRMFSDPAYRGPFLYHKPPDLAAGVRSEADIRQVRDIFDGALRAVDDQVGRLLGQLADAGRLDHTVVAVTADHGENLYEGGLGMGHGDHLRGEVSLRVPLVLWGPGRIPAGRRIGNTVRSIDLAPTLLELAGQPTVGQPPMDGQTLAPLWSDGTPAPGDRPVFVETGIWFTDQGEEFYQGQRIRYPDLTVLGQIDIGINHEVVLRETFRGTVEMAKHRVLYQDGRKLIYAPTPEGVRWELYDPQADPHNAVDLLQREPEKAQQLQARMLEWLADGDPERLHHDYVAPRRMPRQVAPLPDPAWLRGQELLAP